VGSILLVTGTATGTGARAMDSEQDGADGRAAAPPPSRSLPSPPRSLPSPSRSLPPPSRSFLAGPSLRETGRVGVMTVSDPGSPIEQTPDRQMPMPDELIVQPPPTTGGQGDGPAVGAPGDASSSSGFISASVLAQELGEQLAPLNECRIEVARRRRIAWNEVTAGRLTLEWTILPTGAVTNTEVTPIDPIDLHVLDCVKHQMGRWIFARPRGGPVRLSRTFAFR
jgi:hypothetical protein